MNKVRRTYMTEMFNIGAVKKLQTGEQEFALDLAAGLGPDTWYLKECGYNVTSVDKENDLEGVVVSDIVTYTIEPRYYSVIICNNAFPFLPSIQDIRKVLGNMSAGLMPGGVACFSLYGPNHYKKDLILMSKEQAVSLVREYDWEIIATTEREGVIKSVGGDLIYEHVFRFIVRARGGSSLKPPVSVPKVS